MQNSKNGFREYDSSEKKVKMTYKQMQQNQNLFFVKSMKRAYASDEGYTNPTGQKQRKRFADAFAKLDQLIDESDPDTDLPQIYHAYQTGESLKSFLNAENLTQLRTDISVRNLFSAEEWKFLPPCYQAKFSTTLHKLYPHIIDWSWLPLVGFLHDSGKVLATPEWGSLPQWAVVGDTFPIGAPFSSSNVYSECRFFATNTDLNIKDNDSMMFGIYKKNCGLNNLHMSWGHDEYFYSVLKRTTHHLPEEALYIVRFHSFYAWHTPRTGIRGYEELANEQDWLLLPLLKAFQKSDLYSKKTELPHIKELRSYYSDLLERFVPGRTSSHYHLRPAQILW